MNFEEAWYVHPEGKSGGLTLWWHEDVFVDVLSSSKNIIHTKVSSLTHCLPEYISFVYGPPVEADRTQVWTQLRHIASTMSGTWMCVGDFNELLSQNDKWGGNPHVLRRIINFQLVVSDYE